MNTHDILWLAGLIEGEGCFQPGPKDRPNRCTITVQMTDLDIVERVCALFRTKPVHVARKVEGHKPSYIARVSGARAHGIMLMLFPLMGQRRQTQIKRAIIGLKKSYRHLSDADIQEIRQLKATGLSGYAVAKKTGRAKRTVYKYI